MASTILIYELLEEFPSSFFNLDLKIPKIGKTVLKILKETNAEERVCIGSFNSKNLDEIQYLNPRVLTSMGIRAVSYTHLTLPTSDLV